MKTILKVNVVLAFLAFGCSTKDYYYEDKRELEGFYSTESCLNNGNFKPNYGNENYTDYGENAFIDVSEENISTFAIDADGGSYSNMRRFLNSGSLPPGESVRIEEYVNYFSFDYDNPNIENVSINSEITDCPWNKEHLLMRIGLKGKELLPSERGQSNIVLLIDVSGSMSSPDKLELLKEGFILFVDELTSEDRIAIVTYAGNAGVVLPATPGSEKEIIKQAINYLSSGGSTAGAEGIVTAYEIAEENLSVNGNNRIILGTDGDFNVGINSTEELVELIEEKRESGIFLTVLGMGTGNLNDAMMEQLANHGNGNYEYIDNVEQLRKVFIHEYSKFYTVAKDCKIQVSFNPLSIQSYRLIGYENRVLENEEFENDSVDAGEIGAGQTITAFYEIIPKTGINGAKLATLDFRYKKPNEFTSILINHDINENIIEFLSSSENMRFGASVIGFGLLMKKSEYAGNTSYDQILNWAEGAISYDEFGFRNEFTQLVDLARSIND